MRPAQKQVAAMALLVVCLVNAWSALGLGYVSNSVQSPVGPELVSVYERDGKPDRQAVPVEVPGTFAKTGQRVSVYLRNNYCVAAGWTAPQVTLVVIAMAGLLFWMLGKGKHNDGASPT